MPRIGRTRALAAICLLPQLAILGLPTPSAARVNPLNLLARQIAKPNILVVLDTSGSMGSVPGGQSTAATEAGIDCDKGVDCRGWGTPGGCSAVPPVCPPAMGNGCPDGMMPSSTNLVFNGDFSILAGPGPGIAAAAGFTSGRPNAGDFNYPPDTTVAIQQGGINQAGGIVIQSPFPGDPCRGVPATNRYLYSNGNNTGAIYKVWEQTINGLTPSTDYTIWAYISNAINPAHWRSPPDLPSWTFRLNNVDLGPAIVQRNEVDTGTGDIWQRVQFAFRTGAAQTSATLALWDNATGADGDDAAITQINLRQCVPVQNGTCRISRRACGAGNPCGTIGRCNAAGDVAPTGLKAEYYDNQDFTALKVTRTDATINFAWAGQPDPSVGADTFSVRWTGKVQPQFTETYTFYTMSDDGVRLWVNGQLIVNNWTDHGPTENRGTIGLVAGQKYDLKMEFYEARGGAEARLSWSSPSRPKQIIPAERLFAPGDSTSTGTTCANPGGSCVTLGTCATTNPAISCHTEMDCPVGATGSCAVGGAACTSDAQCPNARTCSISGGACSDSSPCPRNTTQGHCRENPAIACSKHDDCSRRCIFPTNVCLGVENYCKFPRLACNVPAGASNACTGLVDVCDEPPPAQPLCVPPSASKIKMCQIGQTACSVDADCPTPGDTCGAPTSRAVIAKRVLKNVLEETPALVNYGLMTFRQSGYFPYFLGAAPGGRVVSQLVSRERLIQLGCYAGTGAPAASCTIDGVFHSLGASPNSQYAVQRTSPTTYVDQDFCGDVCTTPGPVTAELVGVYYERPAAAVAAENPTGRITQATYQGRDLTLSGRSYVYYTPNPAFQNGGTKPTDMGFEFDDCATANVCSASCGGRQVGPLLDPTASTASARSNTFALTAALEKAVNGGVISYSGTPTGCTMDNTGVGGNPAAERYGARQYMSKVLANMQAAYGMTAAQARTCRPNYVLYVTDGAPDGPGDVGAPGGAGQEPPSLCTAPACAAADPEAAGCACASVLAAYRMRRDLGVRTLVVAFGGDATTGNARIANDNIARAGGTDAESDGVAPWAFIATREDQLDRAIRSAVYHAAAGSYSTSPVSGSAGMDTSNGYQPGKYVFEARTDVPTWAGHLIAWDTSVDPPVVAWDAATRLEQTSWWLRRVYVQTGPSTVVKIQVDPVTKAVTNAATLQAAGLGASVADTTHIVRWLLGDPAYGNRAVLGSIVNSVPIDVGPPGDSKWPGGSAFYNAHKTRPSLVYVGADDGMLHAFFSKDALIGGTTFTAGTEAFAFIPQGMLDRIETIYARGGQHPDPAQHVFGIANSPKVRNMCVSGCADGATAVWKTLLVMPQGFGGNRTFVLDVTSPFTSSGVADPPFALRWGTGGVADAAQYSSALGETVSLPAFTFNKTSALDDHRLLFASGYPVTASSTTQGRRLVTASAWTGALLDSKTIAPTVAGCAQEYTVLTDVATARDWYRNEAADNFLRLMGAYVGDTWGTLWRLDGSGALQAALQLGCQQPLHFSPTIVQLDRDIVSNRRGEIYVVQVTNSSLDPDTTALAESRMVIFKDKADANLALATDGAFAGGVGRVELAATQLCANQPSGGACSGAYLPATARPAATPTALLRASGDGFALLSFWYVPDGNGCGAGVTYLVVHDVINEQVTQRLGMQLANEAIMGTAFAGGKLYVATSLGLMDVGGAAQLSLQAQTPGGAPPPEGRFKRVAWTEEP